MAVFNEILQALLTLGESCSEVSFFIPEPRKLAKATRLLKEIKKPSLKANMKDIKILINNQLFF